jgi:hypothetical protein
MPETTRAKTNAIRYGLGRRTSHRHGVRITMPMITMAILATNRPPYRP